MYYIAAPDNKEEKTLYTGSVNIEAPDNDLEQQVLEMEALANANIRCKDPVFHAVMSFAEGECPTKEQCDEAVRIYMQEHEMENCEAFWGLHQNTDNMHIHVFINRVDPLTLEARRAHFYQKANMRAARKIEIAQGWQIEKTGRYEVIDGEVVERPRSVSEKDRGLPKGARDLETFTGEKSAIRMIRENPAVMSLLFSAKNWQDLHNGLYAAGLKVVKKNVGGGVIVIRYPEGEVGVKLSDISQKLSMAKLEKRLGQFEPYDFSRSSERQAEKKDGSYESRQGSSDSLEAPAAPPEAGVSAVESPSPPKAGVSAFQDDIPLPITEHEAHMSWTNEPLPSYEDYKKERDAYFADRRKAYDEFKTTISKERAELKATQRKYREDFFKARRGQFVGQGLVLNAMRSVVADQQIIEREQMMEQQKQRRKDLRGLFKMFPSFKEWLRMHGKEEEAALWRYRESLPGIISGDVYSLPVPDETEMGAFFAQLNRTSAKTFVDYYNKKTRQVAFRDEGKFIRVNHNRDKEAILAAMKLGAQKWGAITIYGSDEFKRLAVEIAAERGFRLKNEDLQRQVEELREAKKREQEEEARRVREKQAELYRAYHRALEAERYRVTAIKMGAGSSKKPWVVDKKRGETSIGYTPEELLHNMPKLVGIDKSERNIYYTPLSANYHFILIDDLTKEKLAQLIADGYTPAVQIESSPGNYQAILKIPKLRVTENLNDDRLENALANMVVKELNQKYGDPNLSGVRHPHRAPGFRNMKQKHQKEDGTYPEVNLIDAVPIICEKAQKQLKELYEAEMQKRRRIEAERNEEIEIERAEADFAKGSPEDAYMAHGQDIIRRGNVRDYSRLDAMIAVRMAVTGFTVAEIERAIASQAPTLRPEDERDKHDWPDYARRTANYITRPRGQASVSDAMPYKNYFLKVEGRSRVRQPGQPPQPMTPERDPSRHPRTVDDT